MPAGIPRAGAAEWAPPPRSPPGLPGPAHTREPAEEGGPWGAPLLSRLSLAGEGGVRKACLGEGEGEGEGATARRPRLRFLLHRLHRGF